MAAYIWPLMHKRTRPSLGRFTKEPRNNNPKEVTVHIRMTTSACPTQWEVGLSSGEELFCHYRFGNFSVYTRESTGRLGELLYRIPIGERLDGCMSTAEMLTVMEKLRIPVD